MDARHLLVIQVYIFARTLKLRKLIFYILFNSIIPTFEEQYKLASQRIKVKNKINKNKNCIEVSLLKNK